MGTIVIDGELYCAEDSILQRKKVQAAFDILAWEWIVMYSVDEDKQTTFLIRRGCKADIQKDRWIRKKRA